MLNLLLLFFTFQGDNLMGKHRVWGDLLISLNDFAQKLRSEPIVLYSCDRSDPRLGSALASIVSPDNGRF